MDNRLKLQTLLEELLGSRNVYFQPPSSVFMKYPAIVYSRDDIRNEHANNQTYIQSTAYQVTVIDSDPDSEIVKKVASLPMCVYDRHYVVDNLNHDTFILYY